MFPFWEKPKAALVLFQMIETAILMTFPRAAWSLFAFVFISHASCEFGWQNIIASFGKAKAVHVWLLDVFKSLYGYQDQGYKIYNYS